MRSIGSATAVLASLVLLGTACGHQSPTIAPSETAAPEPIGEVLELTATGLHELPGAPLRPRDDAVQVWAAHDTNPQALSTQADGNAQAQHWPQELTTPSQA